jgi:Protein of unknown function (DUF3426)
VREAEREARWQSSAARKALVGLLLLLTAGLGAQAAHQYRDALAARVPAAEPALQAWCRWAGCSIDAPRRLDQIVVESTALAKGATAETFRLSVVLRNKASTAAALPWIDLSLTDANGQLVARRALSPDDLRAGSKAMRAGAEMSLQTALSTGAWRVTGYTVEIFYP